MCVTSYKKNENARYNITVTGKITIDNLYNALYVHSIQQSKIPSAHRLFTYRFIAAINTTTAVNIAVLLVYA